MAAEVSTQLGRPFTWTDLGPIERGDVLPEARVVDALAAVFGKTVTAIIKPKTTAEHDADAAAAKPPDDRPPQLQVRSPYRPGRPAPIEHDVSWTLSPGDQIKRTDLHARFGGGRQGGISPSRQTANVLVFSDPAVGSEHGDHDRWETDEQKVFLYCGEGQQGDQQMVRGNRAILDHGRDRRALRVFEGCSGVVRYVGEFRVDRAHPYIWETAKSSGNGPQRRVVMFRLVPVED